MRYVSYLWAVLVCLALVVPARADLIECRISGTNLYTMLVGEVTSNPGGTASLRHKYGLLVFDQSDIVKIYKSKSPYEIHEREISRAIQSKKADEVMKAAKSALKHGLLEKCYDDVNKALEFDPRHEEALRLKQLRDDIKKPAGGDLAAQEAYMRKLVPNANMKVATSNHFILLHDTPAKPVEGHRLTRSEERLKLLEQVYETFLLKFHAQGVELELPKERLMVVLFNDFSHFRAFATSLSPDLQSASGFWDSRSNVGFFFDHGTRDPRLKELVGKLADLKKLAAKSRVGEVVRMANQLTALIAIEQENSDISVVSHECTHMMAGNTGLFPRGVIVPSWVHEGLATYFEAPGDATWAGIGAVNEERIEWYRALANDREHSNIDFIVGDQIFDFAASTSATLHGYAQAWALTHFLIEKHFTQFQEFYRKLGEFPPDTVLSSEVLISAFNEVFGTNRSALDAEWRNYMASLKTDKEKILNE